MAANGNLITETKSKFMNCKANGNDAYVPTTVEHIANIITHGVNMSIINKLSIAPSILGLQYMISQASNRLQMVAALVYGFALVALFFVSTTFHSVFYLGKYSNLKNILHRSDRAVIYLFIAASYTPWLILKEMESGSHMWWLVWLLAFFGIWYQHIYHERYKWLETILYTVLGLLPSISILQMEQSGLKELAVGGCVYIAGIYFFKSDGRIPCAHAIWHLFVSIGASFHFYAVYKYLLGKQNENSVQTIFR